MHSLKERGMRVGMPFCAMPCNSRTFFSTQLFNPILLSQAVAATLPATLPGKRLAPTSTQSSANAPHGPHPLGPGRALPPPPAVSAALHLLAFGFFIFIAIVVFISNVRVDVFNEGASKPCSASKLDAKRKVLV